MNPNVKKCITGHMHPKDLNQHVHQQSLNRFFIYCMKELGSVKILISLCKFLGLSESSLCAQVQRFSYIAAHVFIYVTDLRVL